MYENKRKLVEKQAKELLASFSKKLARVEFKEKVVKGQVGGFREEGPGNQCNPEFRKIMFENAPKTEGDFIIGETKQW